MRRLSAIIIALVVSFVFLIGSSPAVADPVRGGVLRFNTLRDPPGFDSMSTSTSNLQAHIGMVYSGLIRTNPVEEKIAIDNLSPGLAEKWEKSADGKKYTFYLRKGVKWHDGKPFTARDVVYSLNKYRDKKRSAYAKNVTMIDKVEQIGDFTVNVYLKEQNPLFLYFVLPPYLSIQAEHLKNVDPKSTDFLVGTGPFKFKEYIPGKKISYERNPDYFMKGLPYLDGVEVYFIKQGAMANAFIGGQLDVAGNLRSFFDSSLSDTQKVRKLAPEAVVFHKPGGSLPSLWFSFVHKGPWNDVRVRKAMALVIDPTEAVIARSGGLGLGEIPQFAVIPQDLDGALPEKDVEKLIGIEGSREDRIAKAKKLMAAAGYADGFDIIFSTREEQWRANIALYAADMWKKHLNIKTTLKPMETAQWSSVRKKGEFDIGLDGINSSTNLAIEEYLAIFTQAGGRNFSHWTNPEYSKIADQIWGEKDPAKKENLYKKAQEIFYANLPAISLLESSTGCAWRPDLMTGWPAKKGIVMQKGKTTHMVVDHLWLAGTKDAKRWMQ